MTVYLQAPWRCKCWHTSCKQPWPAAAWQPRVHCQGCAEQERASASPRAGASHLTVLFPLRKSLHIVYLGACTHVHHFAVTSDRALDICLSLQSRDHRMSETRQRLRILLNATGTLSCHPAQNRQEASQTRCSARPACSDGSRPSRRGSAAPGRRRCEAPCETLPRPLYAARVC